MRTASVGFADANDDGLLDVYMINNDEGFFLFLNRGCFRFEEHAVEIERPVQEHGEVSFGGIAMAMADFNADGHPDVYLGNSSGGRAQFLLSQGAFDRFEDHAVRMGVANEDAYVHGQISIGDVDGDGYLDMAVGAEQIGDDTSLGRPLSRLYVYQPPAEGEEFSDGRFVDIAGSALLPDFGGVDPERCDPQVDRAVSSVLLRDLDDDGDLDLLQASQADMNPLRTTDPGGPCATGRWRIGVFAWRNLLREEGRLRFERIAPGHGYGREDADGVLPEEGQLVYDPVRNRYQPIRRAMAAYILQAVDLDNDRDLDVLAVVSTDPEWNAQSERLGGKAWRNQGDWQFQAATEAMGLQPLTWTYRRWAQLWDAEINPSLIVPAYCAASPQRGECATVELEDHTFMPGDLVAADLDNDGWVDLTYFDRHEVDGNWGFLRDQLLRNDGDGTFTAVPTEVSGLSENGLAGEAVDLDGDGRLEIYTLARNSGSGQLPVVGSVDPTMPDDQNNDRIYWNAGGADASRNRWVQIRLGGRPERELLHSRITAFSPSGQVLGMRDYTTVTSYKTSHEPFAHFGLGRHRAAAVQIELPDGRRLCTRVPPWRAPGM